MQGRMGSPSVVVLDGLEVIVQLIDQRDACWDLQAWKSPHQRCCPGILPACQCRVVPPTSTCLPCGEDHPALRYEKTNGKESRQVAEGSKQCSANKILTFVFTSPDAGKMPGAYLEALKGTSG